MLESFLDFLRGVVVSKVGEVSDDDLRRELVSSRTTLAGIVKHLTVVERNWFGVLLGADDALAAHTEDEDDGWTIDPGDSRDKLVADYVHQCDRSRRQVSGLVLDDAVPHPALGRVSVRWIYVHMIEETARHAGHADILREQIDGAVGVLG